MGVTLFLGLSQHPGSYDDAYITYRYARNIARGHGFVYNVGESVLGTTTPLYALLLAALSLVWPDIPILSDYVGTLAWALCVPIVYGIGQVGRHEVAGLGAAAFVATSPLFLSALGMETSVYVLLSLLTIHLYLKKHPNWAALCAGLAFLTRWDGILVVGTLLFAEMLRRKKIPVRVGLVCALMILPWLAYSQVTFGSIFPNSFYAKMGQGWNPTLGGDDLGTFGWGLVLLGKSLYSMRGGFLFLVFPILWMVATVSAIRRRAKWWPLVLWTALYTLGYVAVGVVSFPWYYPPLVPALAILTTEGIDAIARLISARARWKAARPVIAVILGVLCLIPNTGWLVKAYRRDLPPHNATYTSVGQWLETNTPPDSSVALIEVGIIGFYSDRTVVDTMGLVSPGMVGHLGTWLQTLQFAVNYYWPDYVVALRKTAWGGVVHEPWFEEAYALEARFENPADPVSPVRIYRRRSGFPLCDFALDDPQNLTFDGAFLLRRIQIGEERVNPGDLLHTQLIWEAQTDVRENYRFQLDLLNVTDGRQWTLGSELYPMRGGNPTVQWHEGDQIVDAHLLTIPDDVPTGLYLLRLIVTGHDPVFISDPAGAPVGYVVAGPVAIGDDATISKEPDRITGTIFEKNMALIGYDLSNTTDSLTVTLYWEATESIPDDYTVFVHIVSPTGKLVAQQDRPPLLPSSLWVPGERVIDEHTLVLPADLPEADYQVCVGLYHWSNFERVPVVNSGYAEEKDNLVIVGDIHLSSDQANK
jgi:hypothetical protein